MVVKFVSGAEEDLEDWNLSSVDLNLLVVLETLLRYRNITHAGNELNISQPATSRALTRLRDMFGDDLLVRSNRSFELTPLAESLSSKVELAIGSVKKVFNRRVLEPERFTVAMPDHIAFFLAPRLTSYFRELSPNTLFLPAIKLANVLSGMEDGGVDLTLGIADDTPPGFFCRALPPISSLCLARKGHIATKGNIAYLDLGRFLSLRIGSTHNSGFGEVYDGLETLRPKGRETFTVHDIHTAARLILDTDAILVLPAPSALFLASRFGLETFVPRTGPELPSYQISLIWHSRWHRSSIHAAVRSTMASQIIEYKND